MTVNLTLREELNTIFLNKKFKIDICTICEYAYIFQQSYQQ